MLTGARARVVALTLGRMVDAMSCCCPHSRSAARFFSFFARRYRRRFGRKGFEPPQRLLVEGLARAGIADASILEIGCGVGHLHQTLLERGAGRALGIDLAPAMIAEARDWAAERGLGERTAYLEGDFMELDAEVEPAEITILDKVVCCYPDAEGLLRKTLAKTTRTCALVYPRDRWFTRLGMRLMAAAMWAVRSEFRSYVHDPVRIRSWIGAAGLEKVYDSRTVAWHAEVWVREPSAESP